MTIIDMTGKTYQVWPFRSDVEDGGRNIGAIDLTQHPDRINEILELDLMPTLKDKVLCINKENTAIMTLGCWLGEAPDIKGVLDAYIQFCFRPSVNTAMIDLNNLDDLFYKYVEEKAGKEARHSMETRLEWFVFDVKLYAQHPVKALHVAVEAYTPRDIESFLVPLVNWLHSEFLHLAS